MIGLPAVPAGAGDPSEFAVADGLALVELAAAVERLPTDRPARWAGEVHLAAMGGANRSGAGSLRVYNLDDLWVETSIAVGTGDTPTPVGEFYLLELVRPPDPDGAYGPFAFGLSGFSEVLESFGESETAIIGLHGTNEPASIGTDVSSGCIRLPNEVIEELAVTLPLGTPIVIT